VIPRLHVVTDDRTLSTDGFAEHATEILRIGAGRLALHVRGPRTSGRELFHVVERLAAVGAGARESLVVNDRVDIALGLGIHRVQLGARSLPVGAVREMLGPGARIGVSVHGEGEARASLTGADYWLLGNVFETTSHPRRRGRGLGLIRSVATLRPGRPVIAIGGVTSDRVPEVVGAGAYGVAVLSGVWGSGDPAGAVRSYLDALQGIQATPQGGDP
jgi:thiazole tautomerase (transcriptional regulator TenI)